MSNMGYCRFRNTLRDLRDCQRALVDIDFNLAELSDDEARAANDLIVVCQNISDNFDADDTL